MKAFELLGHPPLILFISLMLFVTFFIWMVTGYDSLFYEIFHILLAILTLIIALIIEATEKADTIAIQHKLDEIIKALPKAPNEKVGIETKLKEGEAIEDVVKDISKKARKTVRKK